MAEYLFGVHRGRLSESAVELRERIAHKHGCTFVQANIPGDGWKSWFAGPNLGHPFDDAMAKAVRADIEAEER